MPVRVKQRDKTKSWSEIVFQFDTISL